MKTFVGKIIFFSIITAQGVISDDIERLGDASISKAIGENVTIVWNVKGITASLNNALNMVISKGELSIPNIVFQFSIRAVDASTDALAESQSIYKVLASRSTANYTYTGKSSSGQETARVSFTITSLILNDEGSYILTARSSSLSTNVSVHYGPEICGSRLQSEYMVNQTDQLNITSGFCGKPQPTVTCTFDGTPLSNVIIAEVSQYNYTYTVGIPKLEPCDRKELRCTIAGYGKPVVDSAFFFRESPKKKEVSDGVCAGYIIGFEIGVILICVLVYVYLVVWKATKETGKLVGFIIVVVVGLALVIGLSVSYAGLRKSNDNDNCGKGSLETCDKAFIAFGVIGFVALVIVVVSSVLKSNGSKTSDHSDKTRSENIEVKKTGGPKETQGQANA